MAVQSTLEAMESMLILLVLKVLLRRDCPPLSRVLEVLEGVLCVLELL